MLASVNHIDYFGEPAVSLHNELLELILVPGWGSNLISLRHKGKNIELLRTPSSAEEYHSDPILYGIPVLFPPNRIADGTFSYLGTVYHFKLNEPLDHNHSHGLLYGEKWKLVASGQDADNSTLQTEIDSTAHPEVWSQFPHHFRVRMKYSLEANVLYKEAIITSMDDRPFPWGFGFHTTFRFPFRNGDDLGKCTFSLNADTQWQLNERMLPTGDLLDIAYKEQLQKGKSLVGHALDDVFLASKQGVNKAVLTDENVGLKITYQCDSHFGHWVVYNDDSKQGYLCPEPYTWVTNAPNLDLPEALTGFRVIQPGDTVTLQTKLIIKG
ncbi:aldose 1-epimerase [Paenibacillus periandrae]|uniref:aldose 1-epimerase n=1 Tax=Paenibacillus periandrae TaxID=1761741 RepID=UPI001F098A95|nr:aldose 1-epimerase [Paenibacillus periandrae]